MWIFFIHFFIGFIDDLQGYSFPVHSTFTEDAHQCLPKVVHERQSMILKVTETH